MSEKSGPNLTDMINSVTQDVSALIKGHIELAKAELQEGAMNIAKSSVFFLVAVTFAHLASIFSLVAIACAINSAGLPLWAGFLIVATFLILVTALFFVAGMKRLKRLKSSHRTVDAIVATADSLKTLRESID